MSICLEDFIFIDLTHRLSPEIPPWDSHCGFEKQVVLDYADCITAVKFRVQHLKMPAGIGTHMDAPAHCIAGAASIADIPLQSLIAPCCVIDVSDKANEAYQVSAGDLQQFENNYGAIQKGAFVIIYTGWSCYWEQPEKYRNRLLFPSVSEEAAHFLLLRDIVGLGIDTLSPDTGNSGYPVHQLLLEAGKYIVENVANASQLDATGTLVFVLPIKIQEGSEAPIRLIAMKSVANAS